MKTSLKIPGFIAITALLLFFGNAATSQNVMPIPAHASTWTGNARGLYFVAPKDFTITGVRAPTDYGTGAQAIHVVIFPAIPPTFSQTTTVFTTLYYGSNLPGLSFATMNIQVSAGDIIGIMAVRDNGSGSGQTSYSVPGNPYTSSVDGTPILFYRIGWQGNLITGPATSYFYSTGTAIGRVEIQYSVISHTDAGLQSFVSPADTICAGPHDVVVNLINHGPGNLTSVDIKCKINNDSLPTYNWTGNLPPGDTIMVNLGAYNFLTASAYDITAYTHNPNNQADSINSNDTIQLLGITVLPALTFTINPSLSLDFCDGDSVFVSISSPSANTFQWYFNDQLIAGATDTFLYIKQAGNYRVWLSDGICQITSDTIQAVSHPSPAATINVFTPTTFCYGDSVWLFGNTTSGITYQWQRDGIAIPGATASTYLAKESGSYTLTTTNVGNCSTTSAAVIIDAKAVHLLNLGNDMVVCENIVVTLDAGPGADTYLWSTGSTSQTITLDTAIAGLGAKTYSITASLNGCESSDTIIVEFIICSGIENINKTVGFDIFPNPNNGRFSISAKYLASGKTTISIKDYTGRLIYQEDWHPESISSKKDFNLSNFPDGLYFIKLESGSFSKTETFIIGK